MTRKNLRFSTSAGALPPQKGPSKNIFEPVCTSCKPSPNNFETLCTTCRPSPNCSKAVRTTCRPLPNISELNGSSCTPLPNNFKTLCTSCKGSPNNSKALCTRCKPPPTISKAVRTSCRRPQNSSTMACTSCKRFQKCFGQACTSKSSANSLPESLERLEAHLHSPVAEQRRFLKACTRALPCFSRVASAECSRTRPSPTTAIPRRLRGGCASPGLLLPDWLHWRSHISQRLRLP